MKTKNFLPAISFFLTLTLPLSIFSLGQGTWTQKADVPGLGRFIASGFSIGTKGYIAIGYMNSDLFSALRDFWEWDQATNLWTKKADYPGKSGGDAVCFSIGTKGYIGTGYDITSNGFTGDFWEYNPATNIWTQKASVPSTLGRGSAVGFSIGNKGYIGIGIIWEPSGTVSPYLRDFWEWDQATNVWTQKANFEGIVRTGAVGFSIGNKGYIGTGWDGDTPKNSSKDFWEWDQSTNVWTKKADFAGVSRGDAKGFSIGTKGYIGIGYKVAAYPLLTYQDFWEWDQATNLWTQKANFEGISASGAVGFSIGNKGYIGTGMVPGTPDLFYKDFWEYDPSVITGIAEGAKENIFVYPNPTHGKFTIKNIDLQKTNYKLEIYNVLGEKIYSDSKIKQQTSNEIDLSNSPKGIYFVKIYVGEKIYKEIIIKQ